MNVKTLIERLQEMPAEAEVCVDANMAVYDLHCFYKFYDGPVYSHQNDDYEQSIIVNRSTTEPKVVLSAVDLDTYFMDFPDAEIIYVNGGESSKDHIETRRQRAKTTLRGDFL